MFGIKTNAQEVDCLVKPENNLRQNIFQKNPKKTIFLIFIVTIVGSALIWEKILQRYGKPHQPGLVRYINLREHPPGLVSWITPPKDAALENRGSLFRSDDNGFIIPSKVHEHPDRTIVCLGSSTTECFYVEEDKRWPYLAGRLLEKETGLKVNAYNAGMSSNNTLNSIDILINKVLPLKPQVVLMLHNLNDLTTLLYDKTYWSSNSKLRPIIQIDDSLGKNLTKTWRQIWETAFPRLYAKLNRFLDKRKQPKPSLGGETEKVEVDKAQLVAEFRANLETFIQICRIRNILPVLMTQANRFTQNPEPFLREAFIATERTRGVSYEMFKDLYDSFNNHIREVAAANNVVLIDLAASIPQHQDYIYDAVHLTPDGCQKIAEVVKEKVEPLLVGN
jgi:lysophospholipase L1-like esterase